MLAADRGLPRNRPRETLIRRRKNAWPAGGRQSKPSVAFPVRRVLRSRASLQLNSPNETRGERGFMKRHTALGSAALALLLSACGAGAGTMIGSPGALSPSKVALRTTTILAWNRATGKPIPGLLITLSRNKDGGPVIAKGKTAKNGKVALSGSFTNKDVVCAWGVYQFPSGYSRRSRCQTDFPPAFTLEFR